MDISFWSARRNLAWQCRKGKSPNLLRLQWRSLLINVRLAPVSTNANKSMKLCVLEVAGAIRIFIKRRFDCVEHTLNAVFVLVLKDPYESGVLDLGVHMF